MSSHRLHFHQIIISPSLPSPPTAQREMETRERFVRILDKKEITRGLLTLRYVFFVISTTDEGLLGERKTRSSNPSSDVGEILSLARVGIREVYDQIGAKMFAIDSCYLHQKRFI